MLNNNKKRAIIITKQISGNNGALFYSKSIYKIFEQFCDVTCIYVQTNHRVLQKINKVVDKIQCINGIIFGAYTFSYINLFNHVISLINKLLKINIKKKEIPHANNIFSDNIHRKLAKVIKKISPDIIIYNYIHTSNIIHDNENIPYIFIITHDILSKRRRILEKNNENHNLHNWSESNEARLLGNADCIIAIHDSDRKEFNTLCVNSKIITVMPSIECVQDQYSNKRNLQQIAFIATEQYFNREGIIWFIDNVLDEIIEKNRVQLVICGKICKFIEKKFTNISNHVVLKGFIDNVSHVYHQAGLAIVPLLHGTGLKIKLVEALQHGCPVVTTSIGAEGLKGLHGFAGIIADTPHEFANGIISLLHSESNDIYSRNATIYATEYFNPASALANLQRCVEEGKEKWTPRHTA